MDLIPMDGPRCRKWNKRMRKYCFAFTFGDGVRFDLPCTLLAARADMV